MNLWIYNLLFHFISFYFIWIYFWKSYLLLICFYDFALYFEFFNLKSLENNKLYGVLIYGFIFLGYNIIHTVNNINLEVGYKFIGFIIIVNHAPTPHCDKYFPNMKVNKCLIVTSIFSIWKWNMVNYVLTLHCVKACLKNVQTWSISMARLWQRLSLVPMSHCQNHGHTRSTMVQHRIATKIVSIWRSTMINNDHSLFVTLRQM